MSQATHRTKHPAKGLTLVSLWLLVSSLAVADKLDSWPARTASDAQLAAHLAQLESEPASPDARRWLEQLLDHAESAEKPHPEGRGQTLPRYAIAARARHLLRQWDEQQALQQLRNDPSLRSKATSSRTQHNALLSWLSEADPKQLADFRAQADADQWTDDILAILIRRQNLWTDWLALAEQGRQARSLELLMQSAPLDHPEFSRLLDSLAHNPALAGGTATLRARWVARDPQRMSTLLRSLDTQPWDLTLIETALKVSPPQLEARMREALATPDRAALAAWALWQLGTPTAHTALHDYAQSDLAIPHLAEEIATWLR